MYRFLALFCATFIFGFSTNAYAIKATELEVSRASDLNLQCSDLSREAATMRDIIFTNEEIKNDSDNTSMGISAAGAVGSMLIGTATGGVGLAAMGFMLDKQTEVRSDKADDIQDLAEQRRTFVMGIYNAKGCYGPMDHAMSNPPNEGLFERFEDDRNVEFVKADFNQ